MSGCGAVGSALALGARGRRFESGHPDHFLNRILHIHERYSMKKSMLTLLGIFLFHIPLSFGQTSQYQSMHEASKVSISKSHQKALEERLATFTSIILTSLNPEDLQYLANSIFFSYMRSLLDLHLRTETDIILFSAKALHLGLNDFTLTNERISTINEFLIRKLQNLNTAMQCRKKHIALCEQCFKTEDKLQKNSALLMAIESFRENVDKEIGVWATENKTAFDERLKECNNIFNETSQTLSMLSHTCDNLLHKRSPLPSTPENEDVNAISMAVKTESSVDTACWNTLERCLQITETVNTMAGLANVIMALYYKAVYTELAKHDMRYRTFMYDIHGLLPEEKRTEELPQI